MKKYTSLVASKWCYNPFLEHVKNRRGSFVITLRLADAHPTLGLVPGEKLCQMCKRQLYKGGMSANSTEVEEPAQECCIHSEQSDSEVPISAEINEALAAVGESPIKRKQAQWRRKSYAR